MDCAFFTVSHGFERIPFDGCQPDRGALYQDGNISINERTFSFRNFFIKTAQDTPQLAEGRNAQM
jgi:hypothetical protein